MPIMILADINFSTESLVAVGGLLGTLAGAVAFIFKLLMKAKDDQIALALEKSTTLSYKEMLTEALEIVEGHITTRLAKEGKIGVETLVAVVPEHSSPTTPEQRDAAELTTFRARLTAVTKAMGLPPRGETQQQPEG